MNQRLQESLEKFLEKIPLDFFAGVLGRILEEVLGNIFGKFCEKKNLGEIVEKNSLVTFNEVLGRFPPCVV